MSVMLIIKNISTYYGQVHALTNVSLHLNAGEIVTLIGANGAGKTTVLNSLSAITPPKTGEIIFDGTNLTGISPDRVVDLGISQVPEGRQIFKPLSVEDNLELGAYLRFRRREGRGAIRKDIDSIFKMFPRLCERRKQSMGLAPLVVKEIFGVIEKLRSEKGTTILLVEQNAKAALAIADRGYVLETGKVLLEEKAAELLENKEVQRAYLGKEKKEIWER
jgi:branched-chain amino acid transport system ATP-binding protein